MLVQLSPRRSTIRPFLTNIGALKIVTAGFLHDLTFTPEFSQFLSLQFHGYWRLTSCIELPVSTTPRRRAGASSRKAAAKGVTRR